MTALIIEDEIPAGKRLEKLLMNNKFIVLKQVHSVKSAIQWFKENKSPDFVFMDIELTDGNCFEILKKATIDSKIIFTTAYDEYALKAFDYNAIDYLLKPIDEEKLKKMLAKVSIFKESFLSEIETLKENINNPYKTSFLVTSGRGLKKITTEEIIGFVSENNATFLITNNKQQFAISTSLEKLEDELNARHFFRINRKFIVNRNFIAEIKDKNTVVINSLSNDAFLQISRLKMKNFLDWFSQ